MDFLEVIKYLSDDELEKYLKLKIKELEEISIEDNCNIDTIGYKLDYNPENYNIEKLELKETFFIDIRCFYSGYIKKGLRLVYGVSYDNLGIVSNDGKYYYVDDDSYVLEFCKYIKEKDIQNDYELFDYVLEFIKNYFKTIENLSRDDMFKMIIKEDKIYYKKTNEHKFSSFKGKGNAMCSEYSLMACNILSVFDYNAYLLIGREKTDGLKGGAHAFNLIDFIDYETNKATHLLLDFANHFQVYDMNHKTIGMSPFIGKLKRLDEELVYDIMNNEKHLIFEDYGYMILGDNAIKLGYDRKRDYYIGNELTADKILLKGKK